MVKGLTKKNYINLIILILFQIISDNYTEIINLIQMRDPNLITIDWVIQN
jgi:hypothetical protein